MHKPQPIMEATRQLYINAYCRCRIHRSVPMLMCRFGFLLAGSGVCGGQLCITIRQHSIPRTARQAAPPQGCLRGPVVCWGHRGHQSRVQHTDACHAISKVYPIGMRGLRNLWLLKVTHGPDTQRLASQTPLQGPAAPSAGWFRRMPKCAR